MNTKQNEFPAAQLQPSHPGWRTFLSALVCLAACLLCSGRLHGASTHIWSGGGGDSLFTTVANWSSGGVPAAGSSVLLVFPTNTPATATVNVANLNVQRITVEGLQLTLNGIGSSLTVTQVLLAGATNVVFGTNLPLVVPTPNLRVTAAGATVRFLGQLSGPGGLSLRGGGNYEIGGPAANTHTGTNVVVEGSTLRLAKPAGVNAVAGNVEVTHLSALIFMASEQFPNSGTTVEVTLPDDFLLDPWDYFRLNGFTETLDTLILISSGLSTLDLLGGQLSANIFDLTDVSELRNGTLVLRNSFFNRFGNGNSTLRVNAPVQLSAGARPIYIEAKDSLEFNAPISGAAGSGVRFVNSNFFGSIYLNATNTYAGPTFIEGGTTRVTTPAALGTAANGTTVRHGGELEVYSSMTLAEPLTLIGDDTVPEIVFDWFDATLRVADALPTNVVITSSINVSSNVSIITPNSSSPTLIISGAISGGGRIYKSGSGTLNFTGSSANSFTGGFEAWDGTTLLNRTAGTTVLPGPVRVREATLRHVQANQIADSATVAIEYGTYDVPAVSETIAGLDLLNATVSGFAGLLQVNTNIITRSNTVPDVISVNLNLGPGGVSVFAEGGGAYPQLRVSSVVGGVAGSALSKDGPGVLELAGANTYQGMTFVNDGTLVLEHTFALGTGLNGTTVTGTNSVLEIGTGANITGEALALIGGTLRLEPAFTNQWTGPITLGGLATFDITRSNNRLLLTNIISGPGGFAKVGPGTLELSGLNANSFSGACYASAGTMILARTNGPAVSGSSLNIGFPPGSFTPQTALVESLRAAQVGDSAAVTLSSLATWNLNGFNDTVGSLASAGTINLGLAQLTHGSLGTDTLCSGPVTGNGTISLVKLGAGTFTMTGVKAYTGRTTLSGGKLIVNGTNASALTTVAPGTTLGGNGQIGNITASGGTINPGTSPGLLRSGNLVGSPNLTFRCELNGTNAGVNHDQLSVTGTVSLAGSQLKLDLNFQGAISNRYTILANDGADAITGTFSGLAEGATFYSGGTPYRITYTGGTGNDVVVTQLGFQQKPQIGGIRKGPGGQMEINGTGIPGQSYEVHTSTNLNLPAWTLWDYAYADETTGVLQYTDSTATNSPMRFYRFVIP